MSEGQGTAAPAATSGAPEGASVPTEGQPTSPAAEQARVWKLRDGEQIHEMDDKSLIEHLVSELGEEGILSAAQISKAARRKMTTVSQREKQLKQMANDLKDPSKVRKILDHIFGANGGSRALAESWIAQEIEEASMPEEERRYRQREQELAERERRIKEFEERENKKKLEAQTTHVQRQLGQAFSQALKEAGVPANGATLAQMAALAEADLDDGIQINPRDLARQVAQRYRQGDVASVLKDMEPEQLAELLGQDYLRKFRQWDVERVRGKAKATSQESPRTSPFKKSGKKKVPVEDFFNSLKKR